MGKTRRARACSMGSAGFTFASSINTLRAAGTATEGCFARADGCLLALLQCTRAPGKQASQNRAAPGRTPRECREPGCLPVLDQVVKEVGVKGQPNLLCSGEDEGQEAGVVRRTVCTGRQGRRQGW